MKPIKIIVTGASGKMGRTIIKKVLSNKAYKLIGATEGPGNKFLGCDISELIQSKKTGKIIIFDADYETLLMASGNKELDGVVNSAIKNGCVAQPKVMREIPQIAKKLGLKLLNFKSKLL